MITVDDIPINYTKFSGGELHFALTMRIFDEVSVRAVLKSSDDIMLLMLVTDAIRRKNPKASINLSCPYVPYGRQDRVCNPGESLSITVMASIINSLNFASVEIVDPHSDVTGALINNVKILTMDQSYFAAYFSSYLRGGYLRLVSPDAGAEKKIYSVAKALDLEYPVIRASKVRDSKTGNITATECHGDVKGLDLIIADDICDGGRTFIELAKVLKSKGANKVYLYVTHGIFSQGIEPLKEHIEHIYCQNLLNADLLRPRIENTELYKF